MADKLQFFKVIIFARDDHKFSPQNIYGKSIQMEITLPIDAISRLKLRKYINPHGGYNVDIKKNYLFDAPFPIKSYNPGYLTAD